MSRCNIKAKIAMLSQFVYNNYMVKYLETYFYLNYYTYICIKDRIFVILHLKNFRIIQLDIL